MARTKAGELAKRRREMATEELGLDAFEDYGCDDYGSDDDFVDADHDAPRTDGWALTGDWVITTNATRYCNRWGPFLWSFYSSGNESFVEFDTGTIQGIAKLDKSLQDMEPPRRNKTKFKWRGRESGEGEMQVDFSRQTGEVTFKQQEGGFMVLQGVIKGAYWPAEGLRFIGSRVKADPTRASHNWSDYTLEQYERERVGRWR